MEQPNRPLLTRAGFEPSLDTVLPFVRRWLRGDVLLLLLIFFIFHYFKLTNFLLGIDDEYEALRDNGYNWILTGRWASYLFLRYLVPRPIVPVFPIFMFGVGMAIAYPLLLSCFGVKRLRAVHYLAFPLFAGFPTWAFLMSLSTCGTWAGVAQIVVVLGLDRYRRTLSAFDIGLPINRRSVVLNGALAILCIAVAIGFYQAYVVSFIALGVGLLLMESRGATVPFWMTVRRVTWLAVLTVFGIALHGVIDKGFRYVFNLPDTSYIDAMFNLHALLSTPLVVFGHTALWMFGVYGGVADVYTITGFMFPVILVVGLIAIAVWPAANVGARISRLILAGAVLLAPFMLFLINGGDMPVRTLVGVPMVFWLFGMFGLTSRVRGVAITAFFTMLFGLMQIVYASNSYYAAGYFARIHDQELSSAIYARIVAAHPDFNPAKLYSVDFYGARPFASVYPRPPSSTLAFSYFEWDGGNELRILQFMTLIGYDNLRTASPEQRNKDLAEFKQMPVWPAEKSVRVIGDVTLIKLGDTPGWPFNTQQ